MNLELKERVLNLNLYGEKVEVKFPNVGSFQDYEKKVKDSDGDDFKVMTDFLCGQGMTIEQIRKCYPEDLKNIIDILAGNEKK